MSFLSIFLFWCFFLGRAIGGLAAKVLGSKENEDITASGESSSAKRDSMGRKSFFGTTSAAPSTPKASDANGSNEADSDDDVVA